MERVRYHEIGSTARSMARTALLAGERVLTRLFEGRRQPTPKHIVDLGKTASQARAVQLVLEGMHEYRPSPTLVPDDKEGFDGEGNYHSNIPVPDIEGRDVVIGPNPFADLHRKSEE